VSPVMACKFIFLIYILAITFVERMATLWNISFLTWTPTDETLHTPGQKSSLISTFGTFQDLTMVLTCKPLLETHSFLDMIIYIKITKCILFTCINSLECVLSAVQQYLVTIELTTHRLVRLKKPIALM
jgi:hypothetical protein